MAGLDTNVLVRFLVNDDAKQGLLARELIRSTLKKGEPLYISVTVMLELEWVLRSNVGFDKAQVIQVQALRYPRTDNPIAVTASDTPHKLPRIYVK